MATYVDIRNTGKGSSQSLRRYLALGLGLFTLLLSAGLSFIVEHLVSESSTRQIGLQLSQRAAETRDRFDTATYERLRDVLDLAADARATATPDPGRARLDELMRARPTIVWAGYADAAGRVRTATGGMHEGADVSQRSWFKRGLQGPVVEDVQKDEGWPQRASRPAGEPLRFVAIAVPVRNASGRVEGVLGTYLDWDQFRELRPLLAGNATLFVLSRDGIVLHGLRALEGRKLPLQIVARASPESSAWLRERWPDGDHYITAAAVTRGHAEFHGPRWTVVLRQDAGEALAEVSRLQLQIVVSGLALGLLFACLAWWFSGRVATPLVTIADAADRLGAGERDLSIPAATGYREIERLGTSLRAMLSSLRRQEEDLLQARDKLELRVRERAAELTRAHADLEATIVEREQAQVELARAKDRLDLALDAAEVAVWTYDIASGRVELSEQWAAMLGGPPGATVSSIADMIDLVPEPERAAVREAMAAVVGGGKAGYAVRHHVQRANGTLIFTESRGNVVARDGGGAVVRVAGTVRVLDEAVGR